MKTRWTPAPSDENILAEYPRPQLRREDYINLNGLWDYAINKADSRPGQWEGKILVPFSPETEPSGVMRQLMPGQYLWYERPLPVKREEGKRTLLHFGAVDQIAVVFVNGKQAGGHIGGYTPFSFDITDLLEEENILTVRVQDLSDTSYHSRGKQKMKRGGIWYTPQSGIWQTVWLERVPQEYISSLKITPCFDESRVEITVCSAADAECTVEIGERSIKGRTNSAISIDMPDFTPWSPENPHLYEFAAVMGEDRVESYFGMRKFDIGKDEKGIKRLFLNNKPYFHTGLLDQGYFSDGLYTPPSDEAMIYDITLAKKMGFNMLRKHIKIEPLRWYYHCDRLGMLVWQDMINGGGEYDFLTISAPIFLGSHGKDNRYKKFARQDAEGRAQYYRELEEMINLLYNCTSIAMWVPFNEGWGQFDAAKAVEKILALDTTRTIDHASGWYDQQIGDIRSLHVYFRKYKHKRDRLGRAVVLSEFGGYNYHAAGHSFSDKIDSLYSKYKTPQALFAAYKKLFEKEIIPAKAKGLCATVYTQLSDVEDEMNGMVSYDRELVKFPVEGIRELNEKLKD